MSDHGTTHSDTLSAGAGAHGADSHADHAPHGGSIRTYIAVFIALCVLTSGSFMTYTELWRTHFSSHVGWAFMMAISCSKAMLVILFFMHLKYEANWKYVLTIPAGFMSVFLALMLVPDIGMRFWHYSHERLEFCALPQNTSHAAPGHAAPPAPTTAAPATNPAPEAPSEHEGK
ncbi:MAG: cytochrome C oxidase subunit IV family protein [Planctomycetia bacterium]|nr:cytochrome C oxidase subunit IV family protein [Planctomycetia bacterium]